jgi:catechol 2,3-dioxygenase-like lactoylglutathione lyase family enzyme
MFSRFVSAAFLVTFAVSAAAQMPDKPITRPKITGISHLAVYTSDAAATDHFYRELMGAAKLPDPENPKGVRYAFNSIQFVEVLPLPPGQGINRLDHTAYNTDDAEGLRKFLYTKSWKTPPNVEKGADGSVWFSVKDPEGNKVEFVQPPHLPKAVETPGIIGRHIMHMGILVHNRALENTFYLDLLGFRPYWWGGRKDGEVDWVMLQTPDSHDWVEYMLEESHGGTPSTGIPANMSRKTLGSMDHLSVGVVSVPETYKRMKAANRLEGRHDDEPRMGLDGKYQLNLYDPDDTRLELMNFKATEKPCCSPFTADDPAE